MILPGRDVDSLGRNHNSIGRRAVLRLFQAPSHHFRTQSRNAKSGAAVICTKVDQFQPHQRPSHEADRGAVSCCPPSDEGCQSSQDQPHVVEGWQPREPGAVAFRRPPSCRDLLPVDWRAANVRSRGTGFCDLEVERRRFERGTLVSAAGNTTPESTDGRSARKNKTRLLAQQNFGADLIRAFMIRKWSTLVHLLIETPLNAVSTASLHHPATGKRDHHNSIERTLNILSSVNQIDPSG